MRVWNPWHGCRKISPGCANCYVYRRDAEFGKDSSVVSKTANFSLPVKRNRQKAYKLSADENPIFTCLTSDFFLEEADAWRGECWKMMQERQDLQFIIITKRIHRVRNVLPDDWGDGYENVTICCTCETQSMADYRLPILLDLPLKHKTVIHEPMLERIDIRKYLETGQIEEVTCGGESGEKARLCDFEWILDVREQCVSYGVPFYFKQTGAYFKKEEKIYRIDRSQQMAQAKKAGINYKYESNERQGLHCEQKVHYKQESMDIYGLY